MQTTGDGENYARRYWRWLCCVVALLFLAHQQLLLPMATTPTTTPPLPPLPSGDVVVDDDNDEAVDLVYTWVNGSDPRFIETMLAARTVFGAVHGRSLCHEGLGLFCFLFLFT